MVCLNENQEVQLELLDIVSSICKEYQLSYSLLGIPLMSWKEEKGFATYTSRLAIGMLYDEFVKFVSTCKRLLLETDYYLFDTENCCQFDTVSVRLAKRTKVKLPADRKDDEKYYDYYITLVPIFYSGNSVFEHWYLKRKYKQYLKYFNARPVLAGTINVRNFFKMINRSYHYSKSSLYPFERIQNLLVQYRTQPTKYVLIPNNTKARGICILAETYRDTKQIQFEGHDCSVVNNADEWLRNYYKRAMCKEIKKRSMNKAVLAGPEILRRVQLIELDLLIEFDRICRKYDLKYILGFGTLLGAVRHKGFIPWDDDIDVCMPYDDYVRFCQIAPAELDTEAFFLRTQETDLDCNLSFAQLKRNNTVYCREKRSAFNTHKGVFLDIFPFFNGSNYRLLHKLQHKVCLFYKTMIWSHMGAVAEKRVFYRIYYTMLSKVSNKKAYEKYIKWATMFKKTTDKCAFLSVKRNPFNCAYVRRNIFENVKEMEFEGHLFYVPANYDEVLSSIYSKDYMRYPGVANRVAKHMPAVIEIGNLFEMK